MKMRNWLIIVAAVLTMCACLCLCCACDAGGDVDPGIDGTGTDGLGTDEPEEGLMRISVSKQPDKTVYQVGETFDSTGMELTALYADGTTKVITEGYACDKTEPLTVNDDIVTIRWGGQVARTSVSITINFRTMLTISSAESAVYTIEAERLNYPYCVCAGQPSQKPYREQPPTDKNTSGGFSITGLGVAGNTFGFSIQSEVEADVVLVMRASAAHSDIDVDTTTSIAFNDEYISSEHALSWQEDGWFNWENVYYKELKLQEGTNTVLVTILSQQAPNLDCFYILVNPTEEMLRELP